LAKFFDLPTLLANDDSRPGSVNFDLYLVSRPLYVYRGYTGTLKFFFVFNKFADFLIL